MLRTQKRGRFVAVVAVLVVLWGCGSPAAGPPPIQSMGGVALSYQIRVEEHRLTEGMLGHGPLSTPTPEERLVEFTAEMTIRQEPGGLLRLDFCLKNITETSLEAKELPDLLVSGRVDPRTGVWLGLEPLPEGTDLSPAELDSWLRNLLLIPPDGGQVEPGIIWTRPEIFQLKGTGESVVFPLPWEVHHEWTDILDDQPVASLRLERWEYFDLAALSEPPGRKLLGGVSTGGIARVDAATGLVRSMDVKEFAHFAFPIASEIREIPWMLLTLESRYTAVRIGYGPS